MAANDFPRVFDGAPLGADQWYNPMAEGLTALRSTVTGLGTQVRRYKQNDQSRTNNAGFIDDDDLWFTPAINEVWDVDWRLLYSATAAEDGKLTLTFAAGALCPWGREGYDTALAFSAIAFDTTATSGVSNFSVGGNGAANSLICNVRATVYMAATPGSVRLQFAQNAAAVGTSMTLRKGSRMIATRLS